MTLPGLDAHALTALADHAPVPLWLVADDGRIQWLNATAATRAGRPRDELVGVELSQLVHPDDREQATAMLAQEADAVPLRLGDGLPTPYAARRHGDGWLVAPTPRPASTGQRQARALAAAVPDPMAELTADGEVRWLNHRLDPHGPLARLAARGALAPFAELFPCTTPDELRRAMTEARRTSTIQVLEVREGDHLYEARIAPYEDTCLLLLREITELRRAEQEVRQSLDRFRNLLQGAPVGIFQTDAVGACLYANDRFCDLTGMSPETARGRGWAEAVPPADRSRVMQAWERAADEGREFSEELVFEQDGGAATVLLSATPIVDPAGELDGYLGVLTDLSALREAEEQAAEQQRLVQRITDASPNVLYIFDLVEQRSVYANRQLEQVTGFSPEEAQAMGGDFIATQIHPDDRERLAAHLERLRRSTHDAALEHEYRIRHRDGSWRWFRSRDIVFRRDEAGLATQILGTSEDITARRQAEAEVGEAHAQVKRWAEALETKNQGVEALREMGELLQSCHDRTEAFSVIRAAMDRVFSGNTGAVYLLHPAGDVLEPALWIGDGPRVDRRFRPRDCWALRRGKPHRSRAHGRRLRCTHVDVDDAPYICAPLMANGEMLGVAHVRFDDGREGETIEELVLSIADAIELGIANLELRTTLRNQATREPLTGLFNRRYMEESLERELFRTRRQQSPMSVLMVDVDHFKRFNDTHGHDAGDVALQQVATILQEGVRQEDIACRFGGEEFAVILPDCPLEMAHLRGEELAATIRSCELRHHDVAIGPITISVGVACAPMHGTQGATLLKAADQALYHAKRTGRDRVVSAPIEPRSSRAPKLAS